MSTTTPPNYRPDRFFVWCRWLRIYRRTSVGLTAPPMPRSTHTMPKTIAR